MATIYHLETIDISGADLKHRPSANPTRGLETSAIPQADQVTTKDFSILGRDGYQIDLRSYTPVSKESQKLPVMTWSHHGGWKIGNLETDDAVCRYISVHVGIIVINIAYRLSQPITSPQL
jgi:acetyl esterase/lipase